MRADRVPLSSILGVEDIPIEASTVIAEAVQRMVERGDVSPNPKARWQAIEFLAANYLAEYGATE